MRILSRRAALLLAPLCLSLPQAFAEEKIDPTTKAFYELVVGPWAQISRNAGVAVAKEQLTLAALQCHAARNINTATASTVSSISKSVSQKYSRIIIYQKLKTGLNRIDLGTRSAVLFPKLKTGKIRGGKPGFELSNDKGKVTLAFAKLRQNNRTAPVMIEGNALYLKCTTRKKP